MQTFRYAGYPSTVVSKGCPESFIIYIHFKYKSVNFINEMLPLPFVRIKNTGIFDGFRKYFQRNRPLMKLLTQFLAKS